MKKFLIAAAASALLFGAGSAIADTMEAIVGNTVVITHSDGTEETHKYHEDGTITVSDADGESEGSWAINDAGELCTTIHEEETCHELTDHAVGDSWEAPTGDGGTVTVTIVEGQ